MTHNIAITGASGYVGSVIARYCAERGANVVRPARSPQDERPFTLGEPVDPDVFDGIDVLVHAAYDFSLTSWEEIERVNVKGSKMLFAAAAKRGVRIVMISSTSAFPGCASMYGRAKLAIEREALKHGGAVLRLGLVFGRDAGGAFGDLLRLRRLPVIPLVAGGKQAFNPCHQNDLAHLVWHCCTHRVTGILPAGNEKQVSVREIFESFPGKRLYVSVPYWAAYACARTLELLRLNGRIRTDGLVGMTTHFPDVDFSPARKTGISFRPFSARAARQR